MVTSKFLLRHLSKFYSSIHGDADDEGDDDSDDDSDDESSGSGNVNQGSGSVPVVSYGGSGEVGPGRRLYKAFSPGLCSNIGAMTNRLVDCIDDVDQWDMGTIRESSTCAYRIYCRPRKFVDGKLYEEHCYEKHERSTNISYEIKCKNKDKVHV